MSNKLPSLIIGDLEIKVPIIQGGMGVRVSASSLASAVSNEGAFGVIASVGLGEEYSDKTLSYKKRSEMALREIIRETKRLTKNPFGVNIMCALTNYDDLVKAAEEEDAAAIISGAGLPLKLPSMVKNNRVKLIPIISSPRAAEIICKSWLGKYGRLPDAFVLEGPLAGGHLGFSFKELENIEDVSLEKMLRDVLVIVSKYEKSSNVKIPLIAAGGVFDGKDIARMFKLGSSGVQMGTRFVCTNECDAAPEFKKAFLDAKEEDVIIIKSPVQLPGRVVKNKFVADILDGKKEPFICKYKCLATCNPDNVDYCIAQALVNAYRGNLGKGLVMCGSNVFRVDKIVSVKELIKELTEEAAKEME